MYLPSWRNWIARLTSNQKVAGSSPAGGVLIMVNFIFDQPSWRNWIARLTSNQKVAGSSPAGGAIGSIAQLVRAYDC